MARILGIDVTDTHVRATLVRTSFRKVEVARYVNAPRGAWINEEGRKESLAAALREVFAAVGRPDAVIAGIAGDVCSIRAIEIPSVAAKKAAELLPFELEALLPFPIEDAVLDHQPSFTTDGKLKTLAAAAPKGKVAAAIEELREAGVSPERLAAGALALDGLPLIVKPLAAQGPFVLLDVAENHTDLCVVRSGKAEMARTLSLGVAAFPTQSESWLRGLSQTIASYRASSPHALERIWIGGVGATHGDFVSWLRSKLDIPVELISLPAAAGAEDLDTALFSRAAGLAAQGASKAKKVDLRQGEFATKHTMGALRQHARLIAIGAGAVVASFVFATAMRYKMLDARRETLMGELATVTKDTFREETRSAQRARELLEGQRGESDPLPRFDAFDALQEISESVPPSEEVVHDTRRLSIELGEGGGDGRFEIQGTVANIAQRDEIAAALTNQRCFREIEPGPTTPAGVEERINYKIEGVIQCDEEAAASKNKNRRRRRSDG